MELFMKYPFEVQRDTFESLIQKARFTEWGKQYDYSSIKTYEDYRRQVPIQTYEDIKGYVDRLIKGEQNLLWHTEISSFAKSSGTTSERSKYIPVSREALEDCHYKGGKDLLALYMSQKTKTRLYTGKTLVVGGSQYENPFREDSYTGDLSAIIIHNLPLWVELRRTPHREIALMDQWEEKIEQMARATMRENVSNITGVPSWTLVLMRRILEITGKKNISEVWPNLELYMHGGVSFQPYRTQFEDLISNEKMTYVESYNASEGYFGIQDRIGADDMLLMLDYGIFYEFIPMDEYDQPNPTTVTLEGVEVGKNYAIILSTNAGLWRYKIGDTVRFTSTHPYRIQVTGRTKHFINAFGEELIIDNAENALAAASKETGATIREYSGAPIYMSGEETGGHEWLIEFAIPPENLMQFTEAFDRALKAVNTDYEAKRSGNLTLRMPVIRSMPEGSFYHWLKSKGKLGGQHKVPRLANHRDYIDSMLTLAQPLITVG